MPSSRAPDRLFADAALAALYDSFCPWEERSDLHFYLPLVASAERVLDAGCGTGMLLHRARDAGHTGRLCGLDPAPGMLALARARTDIDWILGDLESVSFEEAFDLVVMTGHAFQALLEDDAIGAALAAAARALRPEGLFAFETRNPEAREWERWVPGNVTEATTAEGAVVRMERAVESIDGDLVRFGHTFTSTAWAGARHSTSTLRFLDRQRLGAFLAAAGFVVEEQFGDWDGSPYEASAPELITIARRANPPKP
jgi:SAM-dependent methyltransferase